MSRGMLPSIIYPSTVDALKARLGAALKGTDQTVQSCGSLDNSSRASWGAFYTTISAWVASETSIWGLGSQMDRGEAYEDELLAWQGKLKSANCTLTVPDFDPRKNEKSEAGGALTWIGIGVAALAGAYVVGKVVPLIPKIRLPQRAGRDRDNDDIRVRQKEDPEVERERERRQRERDNAERAKAKAERGGGRAMGGGGGGDPRRTLPAWVRPAAAGEEVGIGGQQNWRRGVYLEGQHGSDEQFVVKRGNSAIGTIQRRPNGSWLYRTPQDEVAWRGSARSRDGAARKVVLAYSW